LRRRLRSPERRVHRRCGTHAQPASVRRPLRWRQNCGVGAPGCLRQPVVGLPQAVLCTGAAYRRGAVASCVGIAWTRSPAQ
jgi:hypothetical protein